MPPWFLDCFDVFGLGYRRTKAIWGTKQSYKFGVVCHRVLAQKTKAIFMYSHVPENHPIMLELGICTLQLHQTLFSYGIAAHHIAEL